MIEIIYLIPLIILTIFLFFTVISLKNNNKFLSKRAEREEFIIKELESKLHSAEDAFISAEKTITELSAQMEKNSDLLTQEKYKNENLLKLIAELKKAKPEKEEDVIIEYFLKTKK
jgi:hypothetical protein